MKSILKIAKRIGIKKKELIELNGVAKIKQTVDKSKAKLILVTATNPTDAGIGKTTVSIGLADALNKMKPTTVVLREPSLGPVFGRKGCATGGGKAQVIPETINLHFTGDFHAITSANNLLCAMIDNSIFQGNPLDIKEVTFHRCLDMNDRALRNITLDSGRQESFVITPASEIMAIMCLSKDKEDLRRRLGNIIIGYNSKQEEVRAKQLKCIDAMMLLLLDAFLVNLTQTMEGTPAMIHLGPFANIAHGCNSVVATKAGLARSEYVVTEAGFGADLGMEKFLDLKCKIIGQYPDCIVLVTTLDSLLLYGNNDLEKGFYNLDKHIDTIKNVYGLPVVVTVNVFDHDKKSHLELVKTHCEKLDVPFAYNYAYTNGGEGTMELAKQVVAHLQRKKAKQVYNGKDSLEEKIQKIVTKVYGARGIVMDKDVRKKLESLNKKYHDYAVMIAKTPYSLSGDKADQGVIMRENVRYSNMPYDEKKGFDIKVTDMEVKGGAEFVVVNVGGVLTMPGLNKKPNATKMICNDETIKFMF